jgi:hypothetical protein
MLQHVFFHETSISVHATATPICWAWIVIYVMLIRLRSKATWDIELRISSRGQKFRTHEMCPLEQELYASKNIAMIQESLQNGV